MSLRKASVEWRRVVADRDTNPKVIIGLLKCCGRFEGSVPLLPASRIEPLWVEFAALIESDARPEYHP